MKNKLGLGSVFFATALLVASTAQAGDIGFINDPELAKNSTALQGLQMQYNKMSAMLKVSIEEELATIAAEKKELVSKEKELSKAEIGKRIDDIDKAEKDLQARAQKVTAELQKNLTETAVEVKEKGINPVVKELVDEYDFDAILNSANVFYVNDKIDVTKKAIKLLNKKMPKVELKKVVLGKSKLKK